MVDAARDGHGEQIGGIEGKEVDSQRPGVGIAHVGAEVEFGKTAGAGNRRHAAELDAVHPEGDHAEPCRALKCIHLQALREEARHLRRGNPPVRKEEIVPALGHGPAAGGQWPRPLRCSKFELSHVPDSPACY